MKHPTPLTAIVSTCLIAQAAGVASAQDWPQWLGPGRDAKAAGFKAPAQWPAQLSLKWKTPIGDGVASPSLADNRLYTFSREDGSEVVRCLNALTGEAIWKDRYDVLPADGPARDFSGPRSSPAVAGGKIVTLGLRGVLSCYNSADGTLLWRKDEYPGAFPRFFTSASPIIVEGLCIAQLGNRERGGVIAFDLAAGNEQWRWEGGGPAYASPNLLSVDKALYVIAETEDRLVALSVADGSLAWETPFAVEGRGYNAATPIVNDQTVFYAGSNRGATAVKLEKAASGMSGTQLWKNTDNSVQFNTPILKEGMLYGLTADNVFFCIRTEDGKTLWTAPLDPQASAAPGQDEGGRRRGRSRGGYGSIVDAGPVLLALTPAGELIVFKPGTATYTEVARMKVAESPTYAYPVISGNRIFIKDRSDVALYTVE